MGINPIDVVTLTQELIRFPSITPKDEGAQVYLSGMLEGMGFSCTALPFGEVPNLFARRGGDGPHLCFAGHTDVVPAGDETRWTYPPFAAEIHNGNIYGRGGADMKANIAAFIAAVSRYDGPGTISLLITGDEEGPALDGTVKVLEWMRDHHHIPDVCIVGEPTNPNAMGDEIKVGRRGSLSATLSVRGVQGHVAYPDRSVNPIPILARMIDTISTTQFDTASDHFGPSTLQVTNVHVGNTADNVVPGAASARFNIRFNDSWTHDTLEQKLRDILDSISTNYTIEFFRGGKSFLTKAGPLTELVTNAVRAVTGRTPVAATGGGTSDARFIFEYCPVVECGLLNKTIHQYDEHVAIVDLKTLEEIYLRVLQGYFNPS